MNRLLSIEVEVDLDNKSCCSENCEFLLNIFGGCALFGVDLYFDEESELSRRCYECLKYGG